MVRKLFLIIVLFFAPVSLGKVDLNVDVFWGWGGCCRPMEWTPVEIGITSLTSEPFAGKVFISAPQDGLNTMNIQHSFVFTPGLPLQIPLVTKLAFNASKADIRIVGEKGVRWSSSSDLWDFSQQNPSLTIVSEDDILIGVIGFRKFGLVSLPNETVSRSTREFGLVYVKDKLPRLSPWDWTAFTSLDLLIMYDPDWSVFNEQQLNAVIQWVSNGGKLLIVLGNYHLQPDNPLLAVLPFEIQSTRQMTLNPEILNLLNLDAQNDANAVCSLLKAKPDANFVQMAVDSNRGGLFGKGRIGFGRVGVLAFDPSLLGESQNLNSTKFWVSIMKSIIDDDNTIDSQMAQARQRGRNIPVSSRRESFTRSILIKDEQVKRQIDTTNQRINNLYNYTIGTAQAGNNAVMEYLYHISQLRPLSIWWIILLLLLFALLLGPVDYIVLKRLDKLPLTWITCCCWIVVFSAGAYYGVAAIRGGSTALRVVSVIDGIEDLNYGWATYYSGLFAPNSADFRLDNLSSQQWWSGLAPSEEVLYAYNQRVIGRNIFFEQFDGKNHPTSVPISIWTMQCLLAEWPIAQMPADASVSVSGSRVTVKINNKSQNKILNGYVLCSNDGIFQFGEIDAKGSKEFSGSLGSFGGWRAENPERYYQYNQYDSSFESEFAFNNINAFFAQGTLPRTKAINAMLRDGAAVVCLEYASADVPFKIRKRTYTTEHIQLVRLVVMPKTES